MTLLMLMFWLIAGGTLQVVVPAFRHMGQPAFPFLLGVVLYAAVNKKARYFVATALLAGVLEDSLSLAPLGCSACAFLAAGGLAVLLRLKGLVALSGGEIFWRMAGSAILGAVLIPLLFGGMRGLERLLGTWEDRA